MKILMQFRTNLNYMAFLSDILIEICNTHTINFVYQTHFFSQYTMKWQLHEMPLIVYCEYKDQGLWW